MSKYQPYPDYQPVDIDWIDEIPSHWKTSKMRYMFSFGKGLTITKDNLKDNGIPCVNYGEVHSKFGFEVTPHKHALKCVDESYLKSGSSSLLKKGDLVFADTSEDIDGSGNFTQLISDSPVFAGYHTIITRPYDRECYRFFAYLIDAKELRTQIRHAVKGVKVFSITQAILRSVNIWLPPLEERKQIAAFLDHETAKIDTLIGKQQQLIELLKEKRQAVISHAVTKGLNPDAPMKDSGVEWLGEVPEHWELPRLKQIIQSGSSISYGIVQPGDALDEGVPFIQTTNISQGTLAREALPKTSALIEKNYPRSRLMGGEVILGIRASIGAAYVVPNELRGVNLSRGIARIQPNNQISSEFLVWLFKTNAVEQYWGLSKQGSTFSEVSIETVREMNVLVPPMQEQQLICKELNLISNKYDQLINAALAQNTLLRERRTALISAAVTGKIDVRNWVAPTTSSDANEAQQEVTA